MKSRTPEEYELLIHEEIVSDKNIIVENTMKQVLYWIGFRVAASQQALIEDTFDLFIDVRMITKKYIRTMDSNLSSCTQTNGRMNYGT